MSRIVLSRSSSVFGCPHCTSNRYIELNQKGQEILSPQNLDHEQKGTGRYKCRGCGEKFTKDEMEGTQSFAEELVDVLGNYPGIPPWDWVQIFKNRQAVMAGEKTATEVSTPEYWREKILGSSSILTAARLKKVCDVHRGLLPGRDNVFHREGNKFHIVFQGEKLPLLDDLVGLNCIRFLVLNPGKQIDAFKIGEFCRNPNPGVENRDSSLVLTVEDGIANNFQFDRRTEKELLNEMEMLKGELEADSDPDRRLQIKEKLTELDQYLKSGTGLSGKRREFSRNQKRAYDRVCKNIKTAVAHIRNHNPVLADQLDHRIVRKNGRFSYEPDLNDPINWLPS